MDPFVQQKYFSKKKLLKIFGGQVKIYDENKNNLLFFVKQKAFKIKEDISIYADEAKSKELLRIKTKSIWDIAGTYDVTDSSSGQQIGALKRKAWASIARDTWEILDASGTVIGQVQEDSLLKALLRRFFLGVLLPQSYTVTVRDQTVGLLQQTFNPFVPQYRVDFSMDTGRLLDRRLGIAAVVMLQIIEGKQEG